MTAYQKIDGTVIQDFARRTLKNMEIIEDAQRHIEAYEVTQLINSLLGLLVFPQQRFWEKLRPIPLDDLEWVRFHQRSSQSCDDLKQLVRYVRNSISHFNVNFGDATGEITHLELWNRDRTHNVTWRAEIAVDDLRTFAVEFINGIIDGSLLETRAGTG
jgi:hypothetical protein